MNAQQVLQQLFGFEQFRPGQQAIVEHLIAGESQLVIMPTGGGKSLCYQVPAIVREGVGIVISPLIALMKDQVDSLNANGVEAAYLNSTQSAEERRAVAARLRQGTLQLLYVAPERLLAQGFIEYVQQFKIALFAIDEAHCISQWGHDFRPEYRALGQLVGQFSDVPLIALTATADEVTRQDIIQQLHLQQAHIHIASFDRKNIQYTVTEKSNQPFKQLTEFIDKQGNQAGIIYCSSRKGVEELMLRLRDRGYSVDAYHAGLPAEVRDRVQDQFQRDDVQIIVATVAFGMGVDKPNIRYVVHYDIPKNIEGYYQETGRAGRDGLPARALLLFGMSDIGKIQYWIAQTQDEQQRQTEQHKMNAMVGYAEASTCRRRVLLGYFGEALIDDCGNCDVCLEPPVRYDGLQDAQKFLSCVFRLQQHYGVNYVIDVLRGADAQKIKQSGHDQLSTYGIGRMQPKEHWLSVCRQLIHLGYLYQDITQYGVLRLTEQARGVFKGDAVIELAHARNRSYVDASSKPKRKEMRIDYDKQLFEYLRQLRKKLADERDVPPFVIFSDATLAEMAADMPTEPYQFLEVNGVGQKKLDNFGDEFMDLIQRYIDDEPISV